MRLSMLFLLVITLIFATNYIAFANEWVNDVEITRLGSYQDQAIHYVWVSSGTVPACQTANPGNPTLFFSEQTVGGKSLLAVLLIAVTTKRKVDIQVNGCGIVEVYYR